MREIKFRAWDEEKKRWLVVWEMQFFLLKNEYSSSQVKVEIENAIFSQYIGEKDKNGVEIYEGDIVKLRAGIFEVCFVCECFLITTYFYEIRYTLFQAMQDFNFEKDVEVVGNIFESKHLLDNSGEVK